MKKRSGDMAPIRAEYMRTGQPPKVLADHFDFIVNETVNVATRQESRDLETVWKNRYIARGFTLMNGRPPVAIFGDPVTAANWPVVSTQNKSYEPFGNPRRLKRSQRVLYR